MQHPVVTMGQPQSTQERLILRARAGDRSAQQELWHAHRRWVAAIILAHRPQTVEVDDLMQDVAVKMVSKMGSLRDVASFRPWLRQIAINICRGWARSMKPTLHLANGVSEDGEYRDQGPIFAVDPSEGEAALVDRHDAAQRLMQQVQSLPPEYREPLLLRCVRSMTYQQISDLLELPVTTIETRLARARRMLRQEMGEMIEEG